MGYQSSHGEAVAASDVYSPPPMRERARLKKVVLSIAFILRDMGNDFYVRERHEAW